jgi:hypothetical protein
MMRSNISSVTVIMEEKSPVDFFKMMIQGQCPPAVGYIFKKMLYQSDADFDKVKALSHLTTSEGRHYRKT